MAHRSRRPKGIQPSERFPVKPRKDGRFQKKIHGRLHYFGSQGDREAALAQYDREKRDLYAGRKPRAATVAPGEEPTVDLLANKYLMDKEAEAAEGSIRRGTFKQHRSALKRFVRFVSKSRAWTDLTPDDFAAYRVYLRKKVGPYAYNRERASVVGMFNHADEQHWIPQVPKFGKGFRRVPKGELREGKITRLFEPEDVNALLGIASPTLFAMILLGLNGGYGPEDCADLLWAKVNLEKGVIKDRRPKTNIPRTVPLWPETLWALRRLKRHGAHVFTTKYGNRWDGTGVAHEFDKLAVRAGLKPTKVKGKKREPDGVAAYALRHTCLTYANEVRDTDARRHLAGRMLPNMDDVYVETLFMQRMEAVTSHVRSRLRIAEMVGLYPSVPLAV